MLELLIDNLKIGDMKTRIKFWVLTVAVIVGISSCTSDEDLFDPAKAAEKQKEQYEKAFVNKFGKIAPDQDWGFSVSAISRAANDPIKPAGITPEEIEKVTEWFKANHNPTSINIKWSDFYAQEVSKLRKEMSQLYATSAGGKDGHINFNNGNGNGNKTVLIQKIQLSGFAYTTSWDSGNPLHPKYSIQYIDDAYYVGFDFEANGNNDKFKEEADGYYADWIIKITPATNYSNSKRIMAEDLGEIGDFDFNDIVFDAVIVDGEALITLLAAGGTLPLYIGTQSDAYEVHNLFGVSTTTMVNTQPGKHEEIAPIIFRLNGYNNINNIPIIIDNKGVIVTLAAEQGKAPGKIAVPTTTDWSNESVSIEVTYPKFKDYVGDPKVEWWN